MPRLKGEHRSVTGRDRSSRLSADRLSVFQLTVCLCLLSIPVTVAAQEIADTSRISVDTGFVARDLDGDGAADHVVREKRLIHMQENDPGDTIRVYGFRMSVYLGAAPDGRRAPHWASSWTEDLGGPSRVDTTIAVPGGTLASVSIYDADVAIVIVLHIRGGLVTPAIVKEIDSGEGTLQYRQSGDTVVVLVTSPATMDGQGYTLDATGRCNARVEWPAMRFAFDATQRRFTRMGGFECVRKYYVDA